MGGVRISRERHQEHRLIQSRPTSLLRMPMSFMQGDAGDPEMGQAWALEEGHTGTQSLS